jgi:hypothetical protein
MDSMRERVAIVGAGVSGLTCAVLFAERGYPTRILAEEIGPRITSAVAGAIWFPYDAEPADAVISWSLETFDILRELSGTPAAAFPCSSCAPSARAGELEIPVWAFSLGARRLFSRAHPGLLYERIHARCSANGHHDLPDYPPRVSAAPAEKFRSEFISITSTRQITNARCLSIAPGSEPEHSCPIRRSNRIAVRS